MVKIKKPSVIKKTSKKPLGFKTKFKKTSRKNIKSILDESERSMIETTPLKTEVKNKNQDQKINNVKTTSSESFLLNQSQVEQAVKNVMQLINKVKKKTLFDDDKPIFMQINCIKIPVCPTRKIYLQLKHSLCEEDSDICLITSDLKKGRKIDHDPTIDHYETLLREKGVTRKITILPMRQLKTEYDTFDLKKKLCKLYDVFLVEGKLSGIVAHKLGKEFYSKHKLPIPVKLNLSNLKEVIENALAKTGFTLHSQGNSFTVKIGHSKMSKENLVENIKFVVKQLDREFPGGMDNVQTLFLKSNLSSAVPFYLSLKNPNYVKVPVIKPKRPKAYATQKGELSTRLNKEVTVLPTGKIFTSEIKNQNKMSESEEEDLQDDNDEIEENIEYQQKAKKQKVKSTTGSDSEEDDKVEKEIEKAEEAYMQEYEETKTILKNKEKKNQGKRQADKNIKKNKNWKKSTTLKENSNKNSIKLKGIAQKRQKQTESNKVAKKKTKKSH